MRVGLGLALAIGVLVVGAPVEAARAETFVEVRLSDDSPTFSETVKIEVSVRRTLTARPTGTVAIVLDGTTTLATLKLRASAEPRDTAVMWTRSLPAGEHEIEAVYSGDRRYHAATSPSRGVRVKRADTTTTLRSRLTEVASGKTARFVARVAAVAPATAVPTGSVTFRAGTVVRTVALVDGSATWRPRLPDGPYEVFATFEGSDEWGVSSSPKVGQRIGPDPVPEIDRAVTSTSSESLFISPGGTFSAAAQVFTAGITGTVTTVELDHVCIGGMGGPGSDSTLSISIKALSGSSPTGAILGSGRATTTTGDDGLTRIDLSTPAPVTQGTSYAIVVPAPQTTQGCQLGLAADGQSMVQSGSTWSAMGHTSLRFRTWVLRP